MPRMTATSRQMAQKAIRIRSTAGAIAYLENNPPFRTLRDVLIAADRQQLPEAELKKRLADGICANHPDKKRDTVERTIRNWFTGRTRTVSRETAFELCLILGLSLEEANDFLMRMSDEAIHWRNPEEIVWSYAIKHRLSYAETMELMEAAGAVKPAHEQDDAVRTYLIRDKVMDGIQGTKEELFAFLDDNRALLGTYHNEAYHLFLRYMQLLETTTQTQADFDERKAAKETAKKNHQLDPTLPLDEKISVETILNTHFFRERMTGRAENAIQKSIMANWPDKTMLSKMKNRSDNVDVSRKVLIMLFLATDGEGSAYQSSLEDDDGGDGPTTRDRIFRDIYTRLNLMLVRCGFHPLDPRSPFDWIVMYCISVTDVLDVDRRLDEVLAGLFPDPDSTPADE